MAPEIPAIVLILRVAGVFLTGQHGNAASRASTT
jgi:hypothetical protein